MSNIEQIAQKFKPCDKIKMSFGEKLCRHTSFKIGGEAALFVEAENLDSLCFVMEEIWREKIPHFILGGGTNVVFADEGFDGIVVSMKKMNAISILENCEKNSEEEIQVAQANENSFSSPQDLQKNCENKFDENFKGKNDDASFCAFREAKMRDSRASKNSLASLKDLRQNFDENSDEKIIVCEAGASTNALVNFACEHGIAGLEEFAGLPGTVGGAVYMNARCFEKEISDVARKISWIEWDGKKCVRREKIFSKENWSYKKSPFTETRKIVTRVEFVLPQKKFAFENFKENNCDINFCDSREDKIQDAQTSKTSSARMKDLLQKRAREFVAFRKQKGHFEFPCAGSVFKNNRAFGEPSGKIIESLGLKGTQIGGAQIASFHANIIINAGGAKCSDVRALVELVKREAKSQRGFDLEEEIIFV